MTTKKATEKMTSTKAIEEKPVNDTKITEEIQGKETTEETTKDDTEPDNGTETTEEKRTPDEQAKLDKKMATNLAWEIRKGKEALAMASRMGFKGENDSKGKITITWAPGAVQSFNNFSSFRKAKIAIGLGQFTTGRELLEKWEQTAYEKELAKAVAIAHGGSTVVLTYLADHIEGFADKSELDQSNWLMRVYESRMAVIRSELAETEQAA